ncbi:MAG: hypothetical protein H0X28_04650 [Solirubrobacterales bacterium]|nr:hypothetical protein [Solirubrobacterales bacterium]
MAFAAAASATPTVTFKAKAVPIPHFPHTGNILGAGTAVEAEFAISGTEYEGSPPPIIGVNVYLPKGSKLHPAGFPTCSNTILEQIGPSGCPKGSAAGPIGKVVGFVSFGGERVIENLALSSFYSPGGGFAFFTAGHSPVSLEILSSGKYTQLGGAAGFGPKLLTKVPLVPSVPGAPFASVKSIKVKAGSAIKKNGKTIYYGRVPKKCPKGGFPVKAEIVFAENGDETKPVIVTKLYKAPCPKH